MIFRITIGIVIIRQHGVIDTRLEIEVLSEAILALHVDVVSDLFILASRRFGMPVVADSRITCNLISYRKVNLRLDSYDTAT